MTKRILSLILSVLITVLLVPSVMAADTVVTGKTGDNDTVNWSYDTTTKTITFSLAPDATVSKWSAVSNVSAAKYQAYKTEIKKVIVSEGITSIGNNAFAYGASALEEVQLPSTLTAIGDNAFVQCGSLKTLKVHPDSRFTLGGYALAQTKLPNSLILPQGITKIGTYAFNNLQGMTDVVIPDTVTQIDALAFRNTVKLTKAVIPPSVTTIADDAFYNGSGKKTSFTVVCVKGSAADVHAKAQGYTIEYVEDCGVTGSIAWSFNNGTFTTAGTGEGTAPTVTGFNVTGDVYTEQDITVGYTFSGGSDASIGYLMSKTGNEWKVEKKVVGDSSIEFSIPSTYKDKVLKLVLLPSNKYAVGTQVEHNIGTVLVDYELAAAFSGGWGEKLNAQIAATYNRSGKTIIGVLCQFNDNNEMLSYTPIAKDFTVGVPDNITFTDVNVVTGATKARLFIWEGSGETGTTSIVNTKMVSLMDCVEINNQ